MVLYYQVDQLHRVAHPAMFLWYKDNNNNWKYQIFSQLFSHFFRTFFEFNNPALWRDNAGLFTDKEGLFERDFPLRQEVIFTIVLAAWGQLVMHQRGQHLLKLQEEPFARLVAVGIHVEAS